jgi:soluble lytic murein transglycosylase-like protein
MGTKIQTVMLHGVAIVAGVLVVSSLDAWARRATTEGPAPTVTAPAAAVVDVRALEAELDETKGQLTVVRLQLERASAVISYSGRYGIPADLAGQVYDVAASENVDPGLAFRLVRVESEFDPRAKSKAGAIGLTQILPSTARLYEPGVKVEQLYDPVTNLRLGFRYLHDLQVRYRSLNHALVAYNRGPGKLKELLDAGIDAKSAYSRRVARGYKH